MAEPPVYRALREFCDRIPGSRGGRTHLSTLIRWATVGVKAPSGERVRLRAVRAGSKWLTTDVWFAEFMSALAPGETPPADPIRSPHRRTKAAEAADRELDALGIK